MDATDWFATILGAATEASSLQQRARAFLGQEMDGVNHWASLRGEVVEPPRNATLIGHFDDPLGGEGVRADTADGRRWKLIRGNVGFNEGDNTPWYDPFLLEFTFNANSCCM